MSEIRPNAKRQLVGELKGNMGIVTDDLVSQFQENGFAIVPGFLSIEEVMELKAATKEVLETYCQNSPIAIFGNQTRDVYFAESGDKIRGFYEEGAVSPDGKLLVENANAALNKVGHALHKFHPKFNEKTMNDRVKEIALRLTDIEEPVVMQSMVIFKHPKLGGIVKPHQDATYLYTDPTSGKLVGFWIALDEASLENGCLHFMPRSHKPKKVYQRFVKVADQSSNALFTHEGENVPTPNESELIAAPAQPGDLVLIDGLVIHQSAPNTSDKPRMAYTFHVVDNKAKWSDLNWLQPTEKETFMKL